MHLGGPWPFRMAWLVVPFTTGPLLADALAGRSEAVQNVASVGLWAGWVGVLLASLLPTCPSLTAVRVATPAALAAGGWAAGQDSASGGIAAVGVGVAAVATVAAFLPGLADAFVDGSSYGPERRHALRPPPLLVLGPIPVAWALVLAGVAAGPLLLAARQWVAGAIALMVGLPLAGWALRSLHQLARRWVVFVPGGMVLHDPLTVAESVLMPRTQLAGVGPAPVHTDALDLSQRALGLALEARMKDPLAVSLHRPRSRTVESVEAEAVLFTPTLPRAVLATAAERRLPVRRD